MEAIQFGKFNQIIDPAFFQIQPGHMLVYLVIIPYTDATISIGTTEGGDDIASNDAITALDGAAYFVSKFYRSGKRIYFTGLPTNTKVIFLSQKIVW